jgi:hypothetical protein
MSDEAHRFWSLAAVIIAAFIATAAVAVTGQITTTHSCPTSASAHR